jgi:phytoene synthase
MNPIPGAPSEPTAATVDATYVDQVAPPGSLRYFSLLYAPTDKRDMLAALYVIDKEIRDSANNASHDVAHTRLQWWRGEVDRLVNGAPQHPATRALHASTATLGLDFSWLHELLVAADMDVAHMTYSDAAQLGVYGRRSGGVLLELAARALTAPEVLSDTTRQAVSEIGSGIRHCELLRDLPQDARRGYLYVPLDQLQAHELTPADLQSGTPSVKKLLSTFAQVARQHLVAGVDSTPSPERRQLRPILVLAALHLRWLERFSRHLEKQGYSPTQRVELKPLERVWVAWRAARRAG